MWHGVVALPLIAGVNNRIMYNRTMAENYGGISIHSW